MLPKLTPNVCLNLGSIHNGIEISLPVSLRILDKTPVFVTAPHVHTEKADNYMIFASHMNGLVIRDQSNLTLKSLLEIGNREVVEVTDALRLLDLILQGHHLVVAIMASRIIDALFRNVNIQCHLQVPSMLPRPGLLRETHYYEELPFQNSKRYV
jgi:hypothetical protein